MLFSPDDTSFVTVTDDRHVQLYQLSLGDGGAVSVSSALAITRCPCHHCSDVFLPQGDRVVVAGEINGADARCIGEVDQVTIAGCRPNVVGLAYDPKSTSPRHQQMARCSSGGWTLKS